MTKTERIEVRAERDQEERIRGAARLLNQSMSAFIVTAAVEKADEVMANWSVTRVSSDFFDRLMAAMDDPPKGNEALQRAAARFRAEREIV
ncbi:MAG: type II toxin-antitoxin system TacA family antitoxin [Acidimicrobiales bacterium]